MLKESYPYYLGNEAVHANTDLEVRDKFSGEVATRVALADATAIAEGIASGKPAVIDVVSDIEGIADRAWTP